MKKIKIILDKDKVYTIEECKTIIKENINENNYFKENIENLAKVLKNNKSIYINITYKY